MIIAIARVGGLAQVVSSRRITALYNRKRVAFLLAVAITIPEPTLRSATLRSISESLAVRRSSNGDERFPMARSSSFPVCAWSSCNVVDAGEFKLDDAITIQPSQFSRGHSPLRDSANGEPATVTVRRLVELMVAKATTRLSTTSSAASAQPRSLPASCTRRRRCSHRPAGERHRRSDRRSTASPHTSAIRGYAHARRHDLAARRIRRSAKRPDAREPRLLLHFMTESHNPVRIGYRLPAGAVVAHKTGTMPGVFNDVGIITPADGKHHIAIAIFTKKASIQNEDLALRVVGEIARAVYDAFAR